jgi:heat shock protein HslJ
VRYPRLLLVALIPLLSLHCDSQTEPAPTITAAPAAEELARTTYHGVYDEPVTLEGGYWEGAPYTADAVSRPEVGLIRDFRLTGDVNGDGSEEAVVLLIMSSGGSGTYNYLAVVGRNGETPVNLGTAGIGDRVQVRSASIADGRIELDVIQQGPGDAACCPSQKARRTWALDDAGLTEVASEITGTLSIEDLLGPEWVLTHFDWDEPVPAEPEVTLILEEGRVAGSGGCNRYFTAAVAGEMPGSLALGPVGSTMMACPEEIMALESRYLKALESVVNFSFLAGRLVLSYRGDDTMGTLQFAPRERAVAAAG